MVDLLQQAGVTPPSESGGVDLLGDAGISPPAREEIDTETGAPWGVRFEQSLKLTDKGRFNNLVSLFGPDNVKVHADHGLLFRPEPSEHLSNVGLGDFAEKNKGKWMAVDETGFSWRDISADLIGPASQAAVELASGGKILGAAAGAALGSGGVRTLQSAMVPGDDELTPEDHGLRVALDVGLAAGGQAAVNGIMGLYRLPHNLPARFANRSANTSFGRKGEILSRETGVSFTPGQMTGNRSLLAGEALARQHPATSDAVFVSDMKRLRQGMNSLRRAMSDISPNAAPSQTVGDAVRNRYNAIVDTMIDVRRNVARTDWAKVANEAKNAAIISSDNTISAIDDLISQYDTGGMAGDVAEKIVKNLSAIKEKIEAAGGSIRPMQMDRLLSVWGKSAQGSGRIWSDLDKATEKGIAIKVFDALQRDLDATVDAMGPDSAAASALKVARDNFRHLSEPLNTLRESTLTSFIGRDRSPEKIMKAFRQIDPSQAKQVFQFLDTETAQAVKRNLLEEGIKTAAPSGSSAMGGRVPMSTKAFNTWFKKNEDVMKAMFSPKEYREVKQVNDALLRLSDRALEGSQTTPLQLMMDFGKGIAQAAFTLNLLRGAEVVTGTLYPRHIAKSMMNDAGRRHLMTVLKPKASTRALAGAAAYFSELLAKDAMSEETE